MNDSIDIIPADGTWISDVVLTPWAAYLWLRSKGLQHDESWSMTRSRQVFDYFVECVGW